MRRDIFAEINAGFDALTEQRQAKIILCANKIGLETLQQITVEELVETKRPSHDIDSISRSVS